jgi:hypothetical protein
MLDELSSRLVIEDLVILRSFAALLWKFLGKNEENCYLTELFVHGGAVSSEDHLRSGFKAQSSFYFQSPLKFSSYRQVAHYYALENGIPNANHFDPEESTIAKQSGNSLATIRINYGRTNQVQIS